MNIGVNMTDWRVRLLGFCVFFIDFSQFRGFLAGCSSSFQTWIRSGTRGIWHRRGWCIGGIVLLHYLWKYHVQQS